MKYVSHRIQIYTYLNSYCFCLNCNKTIGDLCDEIYEKKIFFKPLDSHAALLFLNENAPCITEDEFIIKGIIE